MDPWLTDLWVHKQVAVGCGKLYHKGKPSGLWEFIGGASIPSLGNETKLPEKMIPRLSLNRVRGKIGVKSSPLKDSSMDEGLKIRWVWHILKLRIVQRSYNIEY